MTPSPIQSSPVDLSLFSLVNIEPIPMDQHKQDPLGHVLGGVHNGQHGVNREVEGHKRASNAGEVRPKFAL